MSKFRINRYLARAGVGSRRAVEDFVLAGKVKVNDLVCKDLATQIDPDVDRVEFGGTILSLSKSEIFSFFKPAGVVSTMSDPEGRKTIADFTTDMGKALFPVGRLDYEVRGLMLLTSDGDYANNLLHPRYEIPRKYIAEVKPKPTSSLVKGLLKGIELEDGMARASNASLVAASRAHNFFRTSEMLIEVEVKEGRNHFVKRLLDALGHPVEKLLRTEFGPFQLGNLKEGGMRKEAFLDLEELETS